MLTRKEFLFHLNDLICSLNDSRKSYELLDRNGTKNHLILIASG